jgi:hypothetical protein
VNLAALGNSIYSALAYDDAAQSKIREELLNLALAIATDPNATSRITNATINGQTFSAQAMMTNGQRLQLLRWVVACFDRGAPISTTQLSTF